MLMCSSCLLGLNFLNYNQILPFKFQILPKRSSWNYIWSRLKSSAVQLVLFCEKYECISRSYWTLSVFSFVQKILLLSIFGYRSFLSEGYLFPFSHTTCMIWCLELAFVDVYPILVIIPHFFMISLCLSMFLLNGFFFVDFGVGLYWSGVFRLLHDFIFRFNTQSCIMTEIFSDSLQTAIATQQEYRLPSIFEVFAQENLRNSVRPAFEHLTKVYRR